MEKTEKARKKILIVAGGTGGHIFPAMAFGRWILDNGKAESVIYMSGNRPLEIEIYASHGIEPYSLSVASSPIAGTLWSSLRRSVWFFFRSFRDTRFFLRKERPDMCFLFGSYVSLAPLLYCKWLGVPTIAHEQNASSGKVTRLASRLGIPVASGWSECRGVNGASHVGVPVRSFKKLPRQEAASALGIKIEGGNLVVGVIGGSLGSAPLSALINKMSRGAARTGQKCVFVVLGDQPDNFHATGVEFVGRRWDMAPFYSLCDAVICRAGASTLAELAVFGIPALTIPWSGAVDGHQEANARIFSSMTGGITWLEKDENRPLNLEEAFENLLKLVAAKNSQNGVKAAESYFADNTASSALWKFGEEKFPL